jgi:hypothetical protein
VPIRPKSNRSLAATHFRTVTVLDFLCIITYSQIAYTHIAQKEPNLVFFQPFHQIEPSFLVSIAPIKSLAAEKNELVELQLFWCLSAHLSKNSTNSLFLSLVLKSKRKREDANRHIYFSRACLNLFPSVSSPCGLLFHLLEYQEDASHHSCGEWHCSCEKLHW